MRLLKFLFILLLIFFPFGELLRFDLGNNIRFKPLDIVAGLISIIWLYKILKDKKINHFSWQYILFPFFGLLALLFNSVWLSHNDLLIASLYLIRWISYFSIFFIVRQFDREFNDKLISFLFIDGLIIVLIGFFQYTFFSSLKPLYYLGWDNHLYRLFSVFLDPNYTGAVLVLYFIFISGLLYRAILQIKSKTLIKNNRFLWFQITQKQSIIILISILILTLLALFLTFSRSALIMLIISASIFFILIGRKKFILFLLAIIVGFICLTSSKSYIENMNLFRTASSFARITNDQTAVGIFIDRPLLGVGFDAYRYAKAYYHIPMGWVNAPSHADAGVDNSFLFVLVTTGFFGFSAYVLLWQVFLKRAWIFYKEKHNVFAIIFIASYAGLIVEAMFINSLFFPAIMLWMWLLAGLIEIK